jgi:hypothetical protein
MRVMEMHVPSQASRTDEEETDKSREQDHIDTWYLVRSSRNRPGSSNGGRRSILPLMETV